MRIISDDHDYYDSVQGMGQDKEVIYFRKKVSLPWNEKIPCVNGMKHNITSPYRYLRNPDIVFLKQYAIGFCGQVWPILKIFDKNSHHMLGEGISGFCYNLEPIDEFIEENFRTKQVDHYKNGDGRSRSLRKRIEMFFEEGVQKRDAYTAFFEKHKVPVWVANFEGNEQTRLVLNGSLKELEFYKIKDAYTAFQEIYMYLAKQAVPQKPMPEIDDLTKAELKGFDKWSFRKEPTKNK